MKKSTRFLALLLCLVMVAALMPTFALAANAVTPHGEETLNEDVILLTEDRYGVLTGSDIPFSNKYGTVIYYLFPHKDSGDPVTFTILRDTKGGSGGDWNRWWRWAKEGDRAYTPSKDNTGYDSTAPGVDGMEAWVVYREDGKRDGKLMGDSQPVVKSGSRTAYYIWAEGKRNQYCYEWTGGSRTRSKTCDVSIDPTLPFKTQSILWSSNGSAHDKLVNYSELLDPIERSYAVYNGTTDLAQNYFIIAEARHVVYDLKGGNINGDTNDQSYMVWTSGTEKSSQKHIVIQAPDRPGYVFKGWKIVSGGSGTKNPGEDLNNGVTKDVKLEAQWDAAPSDYIIRFYGNGATSGYMSDQQAYFNTWATLNKNEYTQVFEVSYEANGGSVSPVDANTQAVSTFNGWEDRGTIYTTNAYNETYTAETFDAPLYQNLYGDLANAFGSNTGISDDKGYDKQALVNHYSTYTVNGTETRIATGAPRGTYPDEAVVRNLATNPTQKGATVPLYAQWILGSVTLPAPTEAPDEFSTFIGWYTEDGTYVGVAGDSYTPGKNVKLVAQWDREETFNIAHVRGGSVVRTEADLLVDDYADSDFTKQIAKNFLYGGTFTDEALTTPITGDPTSFTPEAGQTYYVKEVYPYYLQPQYFYVYDIHQGNKTVNVYLITGIDDRNYKEVGFDILTEGRTLAEPASGTKVFNMFTVNKFDYYYPDDGESHDAHIKGTFNGTGSTDYLFADIFGLKNINGYLYAAKTGSNYAFTDITYKAYFVTQDNVKVVGNYKRVLTAGDGTHEGFGAQLVNDGFETSYLGSTKGGGETPKDNGGKSTAKAVLSSIAPKAAVKSSPAKAVLAPSAENDAAAAAAPEAPTMLTVMDRYVVNTYESKDVAIFGLTKIDNGVVINAPIPAGDNTGAVEYAGKDGSFFAGWFADEAYTQPSDFSNVNSDMTTYAKYIDAKTVKESTVKNTLKLSTVSMKSTLSIGSNKFQEVGFVYNVKGEETKLAAVQSTNKVNTLLNVFGANRCTTEYVANFSVKGLASNSTFTVTPYWVTLDGTTVYGNPTTYVYRLGLVAKK